MPHKFHLYFIFSVNRQAPYKSDFARELEVIEEDLKQLRTFVASNDSNDNAKKSSHNFCGSIHDSDTSGDDFIEIERVKHRTKARKKYHGSALNLSSDVDSMYESSSGGGNILVELLM